VPAAALNNDDDEVNVLYVALTRARKSLLMNKPLLAVLMNEGKDSFQFLTTVENLPRHLVPSTESAPLDLVCSICNNKLLPDVNTIDIFFMFSRI